MCLKVQSYRGLGVVGRVIGLKPRQKVNETKITPQPHDTKTLTVIIFTVMHRQPVYPSQSMLTKQDKTQEKRDWYTNTYAKIAVNLNVFEAHINSLRSFFVPRKNIASERKAGARSYEQCHGLDIMERIAFKNTNCVPTACGRCRVTANTRTHRKALNHADHCANPVIHKSRGNSFANTGKSDKLTYHTEKRQRPGYLHGTVEGCSTAVWPS